MFMNLSEPMKICIFLHRWC